MGARERHAAGGVMRALVGLCLLVTTAACGGTQEPVDTRASAGGGSESLDSVHASEQAAPSAGFVEQRGVVQGPMARSVETFPVEPIDPVVTPADEVRVHFGQMRLEPRAEFRPPVSPCQDVLVYVREGTLSAIGTGIADEGAPATLYPGDAVRFGPEGDGKVTNEGTEPARTVVAFVRAAGSGSAQPSGMDFAARVGSPPASEACRAAQPARDPRVEPQRMASERTTEPLVIAGGKMRVRILLEADGAGARHGGLAILDGDPDVTVPEHRHDESAEVLFIEDGEGTMRLGDRQVRVRPGAVVYVPPNALHDFRGAGTRPLRAIQVYAPSGPEQRFRAMAEGR